MSISPALPRLMTQGAHAQAVLDASRAVLAHFLHTRSVDFPIRELALVSGLSERTFYRYFPRKEDAVRPYLEAGLGAVLAAVEHAPVGVPLRDALVAAHAPLLDLARSSEGEALLTVVEQSERLRALWLSLLTDAEIAFSRVIAARLGLPPDHLRARVLSALVVAAGRLALQPGAPEGPTPGQTFAAALDLVGPELFTPLPSP